MKRTAAAALAALLVASTAAASFQDEWERQVRLQLTAAGQAFAAEGYTLTHRVFTGSLENEASGTVTIPLDAGKEYHVMGVCDTDCSDLDLKLSDPAGNEVSTDVEDDDTPVVSVRTTRAGTYTVEVGMAACSEEPCRFGLGAFAK